eukprot:327090-Hanusia_phi.AAC.3
MSRMEQVQSLPRPPPRSSLPCPSLPALTASEDELYNTAQDVPGKVRGRSPSSSFSPPPPGFGAGEAAGGDDDGAAPYSVESPGGEEMELSCWQGRAGPHGCQITELSEKEQQLSSSIASQKSSGSSQAVDPPPADVSGRKKTDKLEAAITALQAKIQGAAQGRHADCEEAEGRPRDPHPPQAGCSLQEQESEDDLTCCPSCESSRRSRTASKWWGT